MTLEELKEAAQAEFGPACEIQEVTRDRKHLIWCRKEIKAQEQHKRSFYKSITFAADNIPSDAITKIASAFAL